MRSLVELFKQKYPDGGVIRIYNLFNLAEPKSGKAMNVFANASESEWMVTPMESVDFHDAPVIVATSGSVHAHPELEEQLRRYIANISMKNLFAIVRHDTSAFAVERVESDEKGLIESCHPSYTCQYGHQTIYG